MIEFHYELDFDLKDESKYADWISRIVDWEGGNIFRLDYIFCTDAYLLEINQRYLDHDTYTDIITFDYGVGMGLTGDLFISVERIRDNCEKLGTPFEEELLRVMSHGILHLLGYNDKSDEETQQMRAKENEAMELFHVEQ